MPTIKHGAHFADLVQPNAAAAVTNQVTEWAYFATNWFSRDNLDPTQETITLGSMVVGTGTFANWTTLQLTHLDGGGNVIDRVSLVGSAPVANRTQDITGLAASTGRTIAQGWQLNPGDSIEFLGTSSGAAPGVGVQLVVGTPG